jgi:hypothetical protein
MIGMAALILKIQLQDCQPPRVTATMPVASGEIAGGQGDPRGKR